MCALAWLWVKLLAPFTGVAELLASGDLMAGFCGPFCCPHGNQWRIRANRPSSRLIDASKGLVNKELADKLSLSPATVRTHIQNIYEKLQVNTRIEAVNLYLKRQ